jgi:hypothetical protein
MGPPRGGGGSGGGGGKVPWDEDRLDESEENEKLIGTLMYEEEGEAKTTKAWKKLEENSSKKPWEQVTTHSWTILMAQSPWVCGEICLSQHLHT